MTCMRCHKLKHKQELIKQKPYQKDVKVISDYVLDFDHEGIKNYISSRIRFRDIIFKVVVKIMQIIVCFRTSQILREP